MSDRMTMEEFKEKLYNKFPNIEVLSEEYINNNTKLRYRCKIDNYEWEDAPRIILYNNKKGCPVCSGHFHTLEIFKQRVKKLNPNIKVIGEQYTNNHEEIEFECLECGKKFKATPMRILKKCECPCCRNKKIRDEEDFKKELLEKNPNISLLCNYYRYSKKATFKCLKCGYIWDTYPQQILKGHGCPVCRHSTGEEKINNFLKDNNINFKPQKTFKGCKDKNLLRFDFFLQDYNMCIEFDGEQHFRPVDYFGGLESFLRNKKHDEIKNNFCKDNNIELLRISYKDIDKIDDILKNAILTK